MYLITSEQKEEGAKIEADFRTLVFANDRDLYYEMFEKDKEEARRDLEENVEWIIPESAEEVEALLSELPPIPG